MENFKNIKNLPLIMLLIVVVIIAIVLSIVKASTNSKEAVANTTINQEQTQANKSEQEQEVLVAEIETEENVQEIFEEEKEEQQEEQKNQAKYFIRINYEQNVVTIYEKDSEGNYTKPVKVMVCSTGTATPKSGTYSISDKYKWGKLFGGVSGQYCTRIVKSILFHSVPYVTYKDKGSLEYWEYDKLGTTASAGCIRLTVEDAKWIYQNCTKGTQVEFYADSNPGPLGKPIAQKISEEEQVRGWDPTDPDENNPWKTYTKEEPEDEQSQENEDKPTTSTTPIIPSPSKPAVNPTNPKPEEPDTSEGTTNPQPENPDTSEGTTDPEPENPDTSEGTTNPEPEQPDTSNDNPITDEETTN